MSHLSIKEEFSPHKLGQLFSKTGRPATVRLRAQTTLGASQFLAKLVARVSRP